VTLKSYYQGTLRETITDSAAGKITAANRTGVYSWAGGATGEYDDFLVEDLVAGGAAVIAPFRFTLLGVQ
jgi:hypothetical protein